MTAVNFRYDLITPKKGNTPMRAQIIEGPHRGNDYKYIIRASGRLYKLSQAQGGIGEQGTLIAKGDGSYRFVSDSM
jgi:hypothetical protein